MKLLLVITAILAFSLAKEDKKKIEVIEDSEAEASAAVELLKEGSDLNTAASAYNTYVPPSQRPPKWTAPNYVKPSVPQNTWTKPIQPVNTQVPSNVQNDYYDPHQHHNTYPHWSTPSYHPTTTTTPASVIKNEQFFGDNGYYKYEYQISDGTHVGEEGYYTDPKQTPESLVKKGWYSVRGADGKVYTTTYWADYSGYHAFGDHLPTPPPVPAAIQEALDKEKEAEKYKPQNDYPDSQTQAPVFYPTQAPTYKPEKPVYVPPQQPSYVPQQPSYVPQQPSYVPQQPSYVPQQPSYVPQQPSYVPQQTYNPPQQTYYPPQQSYNPPQQNYYPQPTNYV